MMVATAAPVTPILKPKMKMGSRTMFVIVPIMRITMAALAAPSERKS